MDSFTLNKIAGAVLGTCLVGMGIGIVGESIFYPEAPKKPGYALPEGKEAGAGGGDKKPAGTPLPVLLAKADPKKGEADAKICSACHNFQEGAGAKVGPDLYGVVDRPKGSAPGFDYSPGMKAKGGNWTFADLNEFITKPSAYVQGTKMGFAGEPSPEKRADILAYLRTLAKTPAPLPPVSDADKKMAQGGGAQPAAAGGKPEGDQAAAGGGEFVKLVAAADPKKGQAAAQICSACHNFKKGAGTLVGPELWGVVDRPKGSEQGFEYSAAMKAKGGKWTYDDLNQFLTKPQSYVQGTKMGFAGEANEKKRAEIVAFLRTLSDSPAPLPGAGGGEAKPEPASKAPPAGAKPGDQAPPPPPNKPAAAQPAPAKPEPSTAPAAPTKPDAPKADAPKPDAPKPDAPKPDAPKPDAPKPDAPKPDAAPAPAPPATPDAAPQPDKTDTHGSLDQGTEPYAAADPQYPTEPAEPAALKGEQTPPAFTDAADDKASSDAPEPYSAPTPDEAAK